MSKSRRQQIISSNPVDFETLDGSVTSITQTEDPLSLDKTNARKARSRSSVPAAKARRSKVPAHPTNNDTAKDSYRQNLGKGKKKQPVTFDEISQHSASNAEDVEDDLSKIEETVIDVQTAKPARKISSRSKGAKALQITSCVKEDESVKESKPSSGQQIKKRGRPKKSVSNTRENEQVINETQEIELEIPEEIDEDVEQIPNSRSERSESRNLHRNVRQHQASTLSDQESKSDTSLKHKIGVVTKKYENLQIKYNELKELGIKNAEKNFDDLQKQTEERNRIANEYLASLKADLKNQTSLVIENKSLKKKLSAAKVETLSLQDRIQKLESSLHETQAENKTLSTKLSANRTAAVSMESVNPNIPGSVIKVNGGIRMVGTAEAALAAQAAQLKEDMYSDLTGLLMRSATRGPEKDSFDCIQTGRNGTLHFKLAVGNDKSAESYDDIQCSYTPLLDPSRDKMLIDLLPDYLSDEITFPRPHAAKFYARVVKALTEKPT